MINQSKTNKDERYLQMCFGVMEHNVWRVHQVLNGIEKFFVQQKTGKNSRMKLNC
jgi:hypothetical protein